MENIVKAMQDPKTGIPVRTQKIFLATIPNSFTGEDLIQWMVGKLDLNDNGLKKKKH